MSAGTPLVPAPSDSAILAELTGEVRRLNDQIAALVSKVVFLEQAAIRQPIYVADHLHTVLHIGGWWWPMAIPTTQTGVFRDYFVAGAQTIEPGVREVLLRETPPDRTAVDIGAHIGLHTVALGHRVRKHGRLVLFEANPDLLTALRQTLLMNALTSCGELVHAAVGERPGRARLARALHSPESTLFPPSDLVLQDTDEVTMVSLDSHFPAGTQIGLVKIDAEGAEGAILCGMARVIADNPQIRIVTEFVPRFLAAAGETPSDVLASLIEQGFRLQVIAEPDGTTADISVEALLALPTANLLLTR